MQRAVPIQPVAPIQWEKLSGVFPDTGNSVRLSSCQYFHGANHLWDVKGFKGYIFLDVKVLQRKHFAFEENYFISDTLKTSIRGSRKWKKRMFFLYLTPI